MNYSTNDIYVIQLVNYLVSQADYQIVTVQQQKNDIWMVNAKHDTYPVIRLCSDPAGIMYDKDYIRQIHRAILDLIQREGTLLILNTAEDQIPETGDEMIQVVAVTPDHISDESIELLYPNLAAAVKKPEDPKQELIKLTRHIEEVQMKQRRQILKKEIKLPKVTAILCGIMILLFIIVSFIAANSQTMVGATVAMGALYKQSVIAAYEYWRIFTAGFIHADIFSLILNVLILMQIGFVCEKLYKPWQYIFIFVISTVVGNLFMLIGNANQIAMGAGAGILGIFGAFIVNLYENGTLKHPVMRSMLIRMGFICMIDVLAPGISILGYIGGLLGGAFVAFSISEIPKFQTLKHNFRISFVIMFAALSVMVMRIKTAEPQQRVIDKQIIEAYDAIGFHGYAGFLERQYSEFYAGGIR